MSPACPKCGTENSGSAKFCKGCGTPLGLAAAGTPAAASATTNPNPPLDTLTCSKCGAANAVGAKFCRACGNGLAAQAPGAAAGPAVPMVDVLPEPFEPPPAHTPTPAPAATPAPASALAPTPAPMAKPAPARVPPEPTAANVQDSKRKTIAISAAVLAVVAALGGATYWAMNPAAKTVPQATLPPSPSPAPKPEPPKVAAPVPVPATAASAVPAATAPAAKTEAEIRKEVEAEMREKAEQQAAKKRAAEAKAQAAARAAEKAKLAEAEAKSKTQAESEARAKASQAQRDPFRSPATAAPSQQAAPPAAPVQATKSPAETCASRPNFISRGLCEERECKRPEFSAHPFCVDMRARQNSGRTR